MVEECVLWPYLKTFHNQKRAAARPTTGKESNGKPNRDDLRSQNFTLQQNLLYPRAYQPEKILCGFLVRKVGNYKIIDVLLEQGRAVESLSLVIKSPNRILKLVSDLPFDPANPSVFIHPHGELDLFFELNRYWWPLSLFLGFIGGTLLGLAIAIAVVMCIVKKPKEFCVVSSESIRETAKERDASLRRSKKKSKSKK
uniref:Cadherin domain-containing protein n=1 Tax=Bursaphelenchus xylophilus TaxID=6326 RepID=A0A1I7SDK7_BURXY